MIIFYKGKIEDLDLDERKNLFNSVKSFLYNSHSIFHHSVLGNQFGDLFSYPVITNAEIMFSGKEPKDKGFFYFDKHGRISENVNIQNGYTIMFLVAIGLYISDYFDNNKDIFFFKVDLEGLILTNKRVFISEDIIKGLALFLYVMESDPFFENEQAIIEILNFLEIVTNKEIVNENKEQIIENIKENKLDDFLIDCIFDFDNL